MNRVSFFSWLWIVAQRRLLGRSDVYVGGRLYMRRWRIGPEAWPGLRLHHIVASDDDRALHDHPFTFLSLILRGGYWEWLADGTRTWHGPGSLLLRSADVLHRIELGGYVERPAWTIVLRGPYRRAWGFQRGGSWVHWREFSASKHEGAAVLPFAAPSSN